MGPTRRLFLNESCTREVGSEGGSSPEKKLSLPSRLSKFGDFLRSGSGPERLFIWTSSRSREGRNNGGREPEKRLPSRKSSSREGKVSPLRRGTFPENEFLERETRRRWGREEEGAGGGREPWK